MTPERWQQIRAVFDSAVEQPEDRVEEYLRDTCGDDADLYSEVRRMMQEHQRTGFLDQKLPGLAAVSAGPPPVFREGQTVAGRYRILRYLNRGGMGEVYQAMDLELNETVALKTLLPAIAADELMIARFKQEIALARKIAHPNVCKVFDLARHEGEGGRPFVFLTMEFLDGDTLGAKLQRDGAMSMEEALPILEQVGSALDAAHHAGVIHRDFKPSNVMLVPADDGLRAVVTDFGLARRLVASGAPTATMSNMVVGTLDYMAPELLTGSAATFASDVYALGMVAYKMVTGALPFRADTPLAAAIQRSHKPVPSPRGLAPQLDEKWDRAILRALDPAPGGRFPHARQFLEALRGEAGSRTMTLPAMTRGRVVAALLAVAIGVGLAVGWQEWQAAGRRMPPEGRVFYQKGLDDIHAGAYYAATKALEEAAKLAPRLPQPYARMAQAWVELEMQEKATEEMLLARRQDLAGLTKVERLQMEAIDLEITREFPAAVVKYEAVRAASGNSPDADADLGRAYEKANRPEDAIRSYRLAAEGPAQNPAAWLRLGVLYARQSNAVKSSEAFAQAERLYGLTSNLEGFTELSLQEGIAANSRGQLDAGAAYLMKALQTARLAGNLQQEINATLRLSTNAYAAGDAAAAEGYAWEALDTARRHQLGAMAILGLVNLGNAYRRKQDFAKTEQYYRDALDLARQTRSGHLTALSLAALAGLHDQTGARDAAVREAQEALTYYQSNRYAKESQQCLTVIARAKRDAGDYDGALASFRSLLQIAERVEDRSQMAMAHENIGTILFSLDRYPEALEQYQMNLQLAPDAEHVGYAAWQCGDTLWRLGRYPEAVSMCARADAIAAKFTPLRLQLVSSRAEMLLSQNRYQEAADLARRELSSGTAAPPDVEANIKAVFGLALLKTGKKDEGLKMCEKSRSAIEALPNANDIIHARVMVLQARIEHGDRESALRIFQETESQLPGHPELQWRALALASRADPRYAARARETLAQLSTQWGDTAYRAYQARPDIETLSRPFLQPVSAIH